MAAPLNRKDFSNTSKSSKLSKQTEKLEWRVKQWEEMKGVGEIPISEKPGESVVLRFITSLSNKSFQHTFTINNTVQDVLCTCIKLVSSSMKQSEILSGTYDSVLTSWEKRCFELSSKNPQFLFTSVDNYSKTLSQTGISKKGTLYFVEIEEIKDIEDQFEEVEIISKPISKKKKNLIIDSSSEEDEDSINIEINTKRNFVLESDDDESMSSIIDISQDLDDTPMDVSDISEAGSDIIDIPGDLISIVNTLQNVLPSDDEESDSDLEDIIKRTKNLSVGSTNQDSSLEDSEAEVAGGQWLTEEERSSDSSENMNNSFIEEDDNSSSDDSSEESNIIPSPKESIVYSLPKESIVYSSPKCNNITPVKKELSIEPDHDIIDLLSDSEDEDEKENFKKDNIKPKFPVKIEKAKNSVVFSDSKSKIKFIMPEDSPKSNSSITKSKSKSKFTHKSDLKSRPSSAARLTHTDDTFDNEVVSSDGEIPNLAVTLLKHQIVGVNWMVSREENPEPSLFGGGILADDMGLGKTVQSIATILSNPSPCEWKSTLIVCTLSTVSQWETEIRNKVTPKNHLKVCLYYGPSRETDPYLLANADIVLTTYGVLQSEYSRGDNKDFALIDPEEIPTNDSELFDRAYKGKSKKGKKKSNSCLFRIKWWRVILDEAQYIKNRNTGKHKAACRLESYNNWCLTGTPIQNELKDIWSLLHFIRAPNCENLRYFNGLLAQLKHKNSKPAFEELHRLIEPLLLRREKEKLKEDIASNFSDLPPCTKEIVYLDFSSEEQLFYQQLWEKAQDNFNKLLARGTVLKNYMHIFEQILRLRQVCDHPYLLMKNSSELVELNQSVEYPEENLMIINMQFYGYLESIQRGADISPCGLIESLPANSDDSACFIQPGNCTLCSDEYQNPVQTTCGHTFCSDCLDVIREASTEAILCPTCNSLLRPHQIKSVIVKRKKARRSTISPESLKSVVNIIPKESKESNISILDLPNKILRKIFEYLRDSDVTSILNLNLTCKRFYAISRLIFGKLFYSAKIKAVVDKVKILQKTGKCVIFSQFTRFLEVVQFGLAQENINIVRLDGSMRLSERKKVIDKFQTDDSVRVFIVSLKAAACGLNLTAGQYVIMLDPWWNGAIEQQAIDRVHRYGQKNPVKVFRFVIRGSIEENLLLIQEKKLKISSLVLDEPCANKLTESDLITMFTNISAMRDASENTTS